jgi:hypothetical protein
LILLNFHLDDPSDLCRSSRHFGALDNESHCDRDSSARKNGGIDTFGRRGAKDKAI